MEKPGLAILNAAEQMGVIKQKLADQLLAPALPLLQQKLQNAGHLAQQMVVGHVLL